MSFAPTLSVVIASSGRASLTATIDSIVSQDHEAEVLIDINHTIPWGNAARQRTMQRACGSHLLFMDDDDRYAPGAFDAIVAAVSEAPVRVHMFRMARPDGLDDIWREPVLEEGNVSSQMVVVPNVPHKLGTWGDRYQGDWDFIAGTVGLLGDPVWHEDVIAIYGSGP